MDLSLATTMPIMITQIVAMFLMMGVGALLYKLGMVSNEGSKVLSNIACYVSTPAVIIRALSTRFDAAVFQNVLGVCAVSVVLMLVCVAAARLAYGNGSGPAQVGIVVSNMGFMGIPLVQAVLGEANVIYISAVIAVQVFFIWTYCVYIVSHNKDDISLKKIFTNPTVISVFVGFAMFMCSYEISGVLESFVDGIANLNTGVGMLVLGIFLAQTDIRSIIKSRSIYKASALRLVVTTGIAIVILAVAPLSLECKAVVLIAFAAPCGTLSSMIPQLFGGDYRFGAGLVTISTLLSILTMPLMLMIGLLIF